MTGTLTEGLENSVENVDPAPTQEPANYLDTLVGDDKKYSDIEALAKANHHAFLHINELTGELQDERASSAEVKQAFDDILAEIRTPSASQHEDDDNAPPGQNTAAVEPSGEVDTATVASTVAKVMEERETAQLQTNNTNTALAMLADHYKSEKAALEAINKIIDGDDAIKDVVNKLGSTNPSKLFKFVTGEQAPLKTRSNTPGLDRSEGGDAIVGGSNPHELTWTECNRIRREEPEKYRTAAFRSKMEEASVAYSEVGLDFYKT